VPTLDAKVRCRSSGADRWLEPVVSTFGEMSIRRRVLGFLAPVLVGAAVLVMSPLYSDSDWHLTTAHWALVMVAMVVALPAYLVCAFVRTGGVWAMAVAVLTVLSSAAVVAMERSDSSTRALILLWVPFLGVPFAALVIAADRAIQRRRSPRLTAG
jgi:hypothetical protein